MGQQPDDVNYFRSDSGALIACLGPWAAVAMFRMRPDDRQWEFLVPGSPTWDAIHQGIYRNMHGYDPVDPGEVPPDLPPLPAVPDGPFPKREHYVLPTEGVESSGYRAVAKLLRDRENGTVTVFVVLCEDGYETSFGDGEFHYFENAFLDKDDAQRYMDRCPSEWDQAQRQWYRLHLRTVTITLDHEALAFPGFKLEPYDQYTPVQVLQSLEKDLSGNTSGLYLSPKSSWWQRLRAALHLRNVSR